MDKTGAVFPIPGMNMQDLGLSKREFFAAVAMQGLCATDNVCDASPATIAEWSVCYADALIAALEQPTGEE